MILRIQPVNQYKPVSLVEGSYYYLPRYAYNPLKTSFIVSMRASVLIAMSEKWVLLA
jgi:hypothetical protein